ncbi:FG-GAP repeat domain-containing protein [Schlesneria paludicola]|uniref:FG-GAP repeat domain-containing protein n=1 Tax=Schlesneria paludicola TaxID=360056 RepID=UPI00029A5A05|nr:VCBS repeat-containing protein [Schlesneria paludicola]
MRRFLALAVLGLFGVSGMNSAQAGCPKFTERVIDPHIGEVCYAVTKADVNGDNQLDIVAVSENRVQWYEAPSWKKHIILEDQTERDNVCLAAHDIDGDGKVDFALGAGWIKANTGSIQWISRGPNEGDKWTVHLIAHERSTHRMSFSDVLGTGKSQLVVTPLNRSLEGAVGARILAFEIPEQPKTGRWPATVLDQSLNRIHAHTHFDWDGDGRLDTIAASEEGLSFIHRRNSSFEKAKLGTGAVGDKAELRGSGEIKIGTLKGGQRFLAAVEPMHGNAVAIYVADADPKLPLQRIVIEDSLRQGHAVWTADLDEDGTDEVLVGHREAGTGVIKGPGLYVFSCDDDAGRKWSKTVIDNGGIAVEDAIVADFTGDGKPDLLAGGRATHNVKLYVNEGGRP